MAARVLSTVDIAAPVNRVLQATFLRRATRVAVYLVGTKEGELVQHGGSFVALWRRYGGVSPSTTALSELTGNLSVPPRTAVTPTVTNVTKTVSKYGQFIMPNEELDLSEPTQQEAELVSLMGEAAGRSVNRIARDEMEDNSTQVRVGGVSADTAIVLPMTLNAVRNAVKTIAKNGARRFFSETGGTTNIGTMPIRSAFRGIIHEDGVDDVRDMKGFTAVEQYMGQTATDPNEFGAVGGVRWLSTEEASLSANGGGAAATNNLVATGGAANADIYDAIVYGQEAYGTLGFGSSHNAGIYDAEETTPAAIEMIVKPRGSAGTLDPFNEYMTIGYKTWMAAKILNATWCRRITHGATNWA